MQTLLRAASDPDDVSIGSNQHTAEGGADRAERRELPRTRIAPEQWVSWAKVVVMSRPDIIAAFLTVGRKGRRALLGVGCVTSSKQPRPESSQVFSTDLSNA